MFKYVQYDKVQGQYTELTFIQKNESVKVNYFTANGLNVVSLEGVEADIDDLIAYQPVEINCRELTLDEFKAIAKNSDQYKRIKERVAEFYENKIQPLLIEYPLGERETWNTQLQQAKAYKASGDEADAPFLKVLADAEGNTVENFANAVIAKAEAYEVFVAEKLAEKRVYERQLMAEIGL